MVAANNATTAQTVTIDTWSPGTTFTGRLPGTARPPPSTGADGKLTVTVPALSSVVLRAGQPIAVPAAGADRADHRRRRPARSVPTRAEVVAQTTGDPAATVTFAAKVGNGPWQPLGTAAPRAVPRLPRPDRAGRRHADRVQGGGPRQPRAAPRRPRRRPTVGTPPTAGRAADWLVVHYQRPAGDYDDWGLYALVTSTRRGRPPWPAGQPFAGEDAYGRFAWVKLKPGARNVGFIVVDSQRRQGRRRRPVRRPVEERRDLAEAGRSRRSAPSSQAAPPDENTAVLHYRRADGDYAGWGLHVWDGAANPTDWAAPLRPAATDAFGVTFRVPLAAGATGLNYIIHNGDTKDLPDDQRLDFATAGREVWLLAGVPDRLLPAGPQGRRRRRDRPDQVAGGLDRPGHRRLEDRHRHTLDRSARAPTAGSTTWCTPRPAASP